MKKIAYKYVRKYFSGKSVETFGLKENCYFYPDNGRVSFLEWALNKSDGYHAKIMLIKDIHEKNCL